MTITEWRGSTRTFNMWGPSGLVVPESVKVCRCCISGKSRMYIENKNQNAWVCRDCGNPGPGWLHECDVCGDPYMPNKFPDYDAICQNCNGE